MATTVTVEKCGRPPEVNVGPAPTPVPTAGQVLVQTIAADVQPLDRQVAAGGIPGVVAPYQPGSSAIVRHNDRPHALLGGLVGMGMFAPGTFADELAVPPALLVPVPEGLAPDVAAAGVGSVMSARLALFDHADVQPGETVLVMGATGAVGSAAVVLAAGHGCQVLAATRTPRDAPPPHGITMIGTDELPSDAADVIIDPVGGNGMVTVIGAGRRRCRHVVVGYAGGIAATVPLPILLLREHRLLGFNMHATPTARARQVAADALDDLATHRIRPKIAERASLDQAGRLLSDAPSDGRAILLLGATSSTR